MKTGLIALIACVILSALPSHPASPVLVSDKDTVAGIDTGLWDGKGPWFAPQYIRIRNTSTRTVSLDSLRIPSDSIEASSFVSRLELAFAVRNHATGKQVRVYTNTSLKSRPIAVPAGDSVDLGQFEIGKMYFYAKSSAQAAPQRYQPGDSIVAPLILFGGDDSVKFTLKAKVSTFVYVPSGIAIRPGQRGSAGTSRTVTVDGRSTSEAQPVARILFR
jgi:hypothetical protein